MSASLQHPRDAPLMLGQILVLHFRCCRFWQAGQSTPCVTASRAFPSMPSLSQHAKPFPASHRTFMASRSPSPRSRAPSVPTPSFRRPQSPRSASILASHLHLPPLQRRRVQPHAARLLLRS